MYRIGIDIGSTFTKYCIRDEAAGKLELYAEETPVRQREYFEDKLSQLKAEYPDCSVVTCGYGRKNIGYDRTVSELTALAAGAACLCPETSVVLDIGGQDTKIIRHEDGRLKAFFLNEKCAAGCGLFLGNVLRMLRTDFAAIDLREAAERELRLSSVCAVFAQSEIVELLANGAEGGDIVRAVLRQIFTQARALLRKVDCSSLVLSGGLTKIPGVGDFAEQILEKQVAVPRNGAYLSAVGCAVYK